LYILIRDITDMIVLTNMGGDMSYPRGGGEMSEGNVQGGMSVWAGLVLLCSLLTLPPYIVHKMNSIIGLWTIDGLMAVFHRKIVVFTT